MNQVFKWFFVNKHGKVVVWQTPNLPLLGWIVFLVAAKLLPNGDWRSAASLLSMISLLLWALLEIFAGASYFRRVLGAAVLLAILWSRFH